MPMEPGTLPVLPDLASEPMSELATLEDKVDSSQPVQGSTKSELYDTIQLKPSAAILAGAQKYREKGIFIGVDGGKYKLFFGDPAGDYVDFNGTNLDISGGISVDTIDIGGSDNTSFHVDIDGNMWLGASTYASAPFRVSNNGVLVASGVTASGELTAQTIFTAGEALASGDLVDITSADTVKRHAPTSIPTTSTTTFTSTASGGGGGSTQGPYASRMLKLTSSLFVFSCGYSSGTPTISLFRMPYTQSTLTFGTIGTSFTGTALGTPTNFDLVKISSTHALQTTSKSNDFRARVVDFTSSVTLGTEVTVDNTNVNNGFCGYVSDSHVLFFSENTSAVTIQFHQYTLSGTTLTADTSGTVATPSGAFLMKGVYQFPGTNYFLFIIQNTAAGEAQALIGLYDTGTKTFSVGSFASFPSGADLSGTDGIQAGFAGLSSTQIIVACGTSSTAGSIFLVTRSGTTATVGTQNALPTRGSSAAYCIAEINARCASYSSINGTTMTHQMWELNSAGTDIAVRVSTTTTQNPSTTTTNTGSALASFTTNPTTFAYLGSQETGGAGTAGINVGAAAFPLSSATGIAISSAAAAASVTAIISGNSTALSGLTAGSKYYADYGGLVTTDSNGSPDKVGIAKDTGEIIVKSW